VIFLNPHEHSYRRAAGGDTWHFCKRCSTWPEGNYIELVAPDYGLKDVELCAECVARRLTTIAGWKRSSTISRRGRFRRRLHLNRPA